MAAGFAASACANAVGNLITEYASPYVGYFFRYGKIVEEFKNQLRLLELKNKELKRRVEEATSQTEVIEQHVEEWLKEAEQQLEDAQGLEAEIERQKCFNWCPTWGWRYCLSKKVARKTFSINQFIQRCDFQRVGYRASLQGIEFFPSKDFKSSKSSNLAFDEIMRALHDDSVNMIGLFGMPGVGKTTLAKEVGRQAKEQMLGRQAKEQKLFDKVLMVTMSQNPNISNIQGRLAELLSLKFEASTEEGKAEELMRRLKSEKKILIIIDDVWKEFRLQTIGIPFAEHDGCKIFLTTRRQQVCVGMNCQKTIQLHILSDDEAWDLFKDNAGLRDAPSTLNDVAKEVASECKGLPLAIVTIGKALKGADLNGWKAANQRFKDSRLLDNEDVCEGLYDRLKLSYDYLKGDNIQSCFLLCSLFPEDSDIGIERLIMYGIGYGLFSNVNSMDVLRVEICEAIKKLQESSLLLKTDDIDDEMEEEENEIYVRMHDVIRDLAHWITLREKNTFMVKEGLIEWPISESFECCTSISYWESHINTFPDKLKFPKLKILVLEGKNSMAIPSVFFEGMKTLQILHLKNVSFSLEVFKIIRNFRTLCFECCKLENISFLRYLENLEILALFDTNIHELPEELMTLHRLKSLHFSATYDQEGNFPPNLLSRLTSLQELHVTCPNNINLWELNSLSRLTALSLEVSTDHQCFQENFVFPKLSRYWIAVGGYSALSFMGKLKSKTLEIGDFLYSLSAFKELFCNVEKLALFYVMELKNLVPSLDQKGLNELTSLGLVRCNAIEYLTDTKRENGPTSPPPISFLQNLKDVLIESCERLEVLFQMDGSLEKKAVVEHEVAPLSNLMRLKLAGLDNLKWLWKGPDHFFSLKSLKAVIIMECCELKYLFSPSLAQSLVLLEKLEIKSCHELEHIITESKNDDNIESDGGHLHPPLFPKLTSLEIRECKRLEYVCQIPLAQGLPHLQSLDITDAPQLKHVFNVAKEKNVVNHAIALPRLQLLRLGKLKILSCLCSENYPIMSPSLEELSVWNCPQLEFFNIQQEVNKEIQLKDLNLERVGNECHTTNWEKIFQIQTEKITPRYTHQLQGTIQFPSLQYLRQLKVSYFNKLKTLFSVMVAQNLRQLINLWIVDCEELEEIIEIDQTSIASSSHAHIQPIFFPSLEVIRIKGHSNLKSLFPISVIRSLSKLKEIYIDGASKLEKVFGYQVELNVEDDQTEIVFPALTRLELSELPSLNSFALRVYHFQFPFLDYFKATKCQNLIVHAITEEPQQAQNNTAKDFNTVKETVDNQSTNNDMIWTYELGRGRIPLYMNVGETRIILRKEVKK